MEYVHFLRNINNQSTAICRQIIRVDIEVEYLGDNIIYYCIFLQIIQFKKSSMELVWKYGRLSSIPFLKSSIPVLCGIFHRPYQNFRSIPFSIPYHALVVDSILLLLLLHFAPTVVAKLKIRKRLILKKLLCFQLLFKTFASEFASASNLFHQSASASTKK